MVRHAVLRAVQQATFYLVVAATIVFSIYRRNTLLLGNEGASLVSIELSPNGVQLLAAGILLASSAVSLLRRRAGALLALGGSIVAGVAFAGSLGLYGWFLVLAAFIARSAWPPLFWGYLFPIALLAFIVAYSRRVREHPDDSPTVWYWLSREHKPETGLLTIVASLIGVLTMFGQVELVRNLESHPVELRDDSRPSRPYNTVLAFVDYPCYELISSSPSLHEYALSTQGQALEMVLERRHTLEGVWYYEVQRVGDWEGSANFNGLFLSVRARPGEEPNCTPRGPFKEPYSLVPKQED
ncbi:MAG TPA: hypothetical protein VF707_16635 [Ardenticatenaceae bacterium]|jgi:hypothetical protein